jgi:hypothetical protein
VRLEHGKYVKREVAEDQNGHLVRVGRHY